MAEAGTVANTLTHLAVKQIAFSPKKGTKKKKGDDKTQQPHMQARFTAQEPLQARWEKLLKIFSKLLCKLAMRIKKPFMDTRLQNLMLSCCDQTWLI